MNSEKHTISILVENEFGVLARVAGMFAGRGFNIEALAVAPTRDAKVSRITLMTQGNPQIIEQIVKQLNRLVDVLQVIDVSRENCLCLELMLLKFKVKKSERADFEKLIEDFSAKIVDEVQDYIIVQFINPHEQNEKLLASFQAYPLIEMMRTGNIAMQKGEKHLSSDQASSL